MEIKISRVETIEDYERCEELQRKVWGRDDLQIVPKNQLIASQISGGLVLGAYDNQGNMVGFVYGFPGIMEGRPIHYSHMLGVDPEFQGKGIGYYLKLEQRRYALDQGLDLICWTFDPLEARNASLNFRKLGVIADRYKVNLYGTPTVGRYKDLDTDRFLVKWLIKSQRVERRLSGQDEMEKLKSFFQDWEEFKVNRTNLGPHGLLRITGLDLDREDLILFLEIPDDFQGMKSRDLGLARAWREAVREVCLNYLEKGYAVIEFLSTLHQGVRRNLYLLGLRGGIYETGGR